MAAVLKLPKGALPASPRHVLTVLAWHCNELAVRRGKRECWPSLNTLANETSLDRTTCMRAIVVLVARRFLEVDRHPRVGNRYRLTDPKTWPTRGVAQPAPGSVTQPAPGRVTQPLSADQARALLRKLAEQVARRNQSGRMARPEQEFRNSEQEASNITTNTKSERGTVPRPRSREEQLALVRSMSEHANATAIDENAEGKASE